MKNMTAYKFITRISSNGTIQIKKVLFDTNIIVRHQVKNNIVPK